VQRTITTDNVGPAARRAPGIVLQGHSPGRCLDPIAGEVVVQHSFDPLFLILVYMTVGLTAVAAALVWV
jgi:hypothetical protein